MAGGNKFALPARIRGIIDREGHLQSGGGDLHKLHGLHRPGGADGVANGDVADAAHGNDLPGGRLGDRSLGQAVKLVKGHCLGLLGSLVGGVVVANGDLLVLENLPPLDAANSNAAHKFVVIDRADQHLEGGVHVALGTGNIVQDGLEEGHQVGPRLLGRIAGGSLPAGAEEHGGVQLLIGSVQVQQQLQHLVHHLVDPLVGAVDLVDHHNDPVAQLQGAAQHKPGLGHRTLSGVHQQDHAVDHLQNTLHLAAKVGVARGVHDVDLGVLVVDSGVLCQNGNAPLPLQVARVHDPVYGGLVLPVDAALLEHLVYQGGLAVVNVGNNGYVSDFFVLQCLAPLFFSLNRSILHHEQAKCNPPFHGLCCSPRKSPLDY